MTEEMIRPMTLVDYEDPESHVPVKACSPDNGRTVKVYFTPWGIVWHADDVEVLWNDFLKDKVKSALSIDWNDIQNKPSLVTSSELEARLDNLPAPTVKWSDIQDKPTIPSIDGLAKESALLDYAKLADIPKLPDLSGYALKNELPSIDTSDLHKIKKPSEYSDGFYYEVKTLADLGIDLTKYDKSVQNGWIGLVKSERVSIFNTVYVTQTVRMLGSYRPTTFIRNGSDDTWYPFELLNTWS